MRALRRHDYTPRIELTPLIDVVLLLLTFFIYSVAMMIRAQVMPVKLTPLDPASSAVAHNEPGQIDWITVTRQGQLFYNRQPITSERFKSLLAEMARKPAADRGRLYLTMEADDDSAAQPIDRGPLLFGLIGQINAAGITNFTIVGPPESPTPPPSPDHRNSSPPAGGSRP